MLQMDAEKYVPGDCNNNWKRGWDGLDGGGETELIDGEEYPMLPGGLVPW